jgi:large subunit ribosomal protein L7A
MIKYNLCDFLGQNKILPFLRILFRRNTMVNRLAGKKVIGVKQTLKSIQNGQGKIVYIAKDADSKLIEPVEKLAINASIDLVYIETMKELGRLCGIEVGAATALILKE